MDIWLAYSPLEVYCSGKSGDHDGKIIYKIM